MNTCRLTIYSEACQGTSSDCSCVISANLPTGEYQLVLESFVPHEAHACVISASGIFTNDSFDNRVLGENINLAVCPPAGLHQPVTADSIGVRLHSNLSHQTIRFQIRTLSGQPQTAISKWVLSAVIIPVVTDKDR